MTAGGASDVGARNASNVIMSYLGRRAVSIFLPTSEYFAYFAMISFMAAESLRGLRRDKRRLGYSSVSGGAQPLRIRGIYPPADHFSVFVLRYNFAIEL